jgi:hypothetical protein
MSNLKYSYVDFANVITGDSLYKKLIEKALNLKLEHTENHSEADILLIGPYGMNKQFYGEEKTNAWRIFITGENQRPDYRWCDCSLTFDRFDNGGKNFRFPVWMLELNWFEDLKSTFTPEESEWLINKNRPLARCLENIQARKKKVVSIFNNPEHYRVSIFLKLAECGMAYGIGKPFGNWMDIPDPHDCYREKCNIISQYLINHCFENSIFPGYYTEKPLHARAMGCLPLIFCDDHISMDFNPHGFLNLNNYILENEFIEYIRFLLMRNDILKSKVDQDIFSKKPSLDGVLDFLSKQYNKFETR